MTESVSFSVFRANTEHFEIARQAMEGIHERKPIDEPTLKAFLADPACYLILAVSNACVVGSLNGYSLRQPHREAPQFLLYEVDVADAYRRRGIGRSLVNAFAAEACAAGASEQWVVSNESNEPAIAMYRQCGFERTNHDDVMLSMNL
jgi:ribosomal protein S18 acetylase RimI-like enzyme